MSRPKTKSALVDGISELVDSLRNIESQLAILIKAQKSSSGKRRGPGRPAGSGKKRKPGRPPGKHKRPGRPKITKKRKVGRPGKKRGRGRPPGSKNK